MHNKHWFLLFIGIQLVGLQIAFAEDNSAYMPIKTYVHVNTADAKNPNQFVKNIKKNLITILAEDKILSEGYPKSCAYKVLADRSQICVADDSISSEVSSQWLLSEEGWVLRIVIYDFPSPMFYAKQIYLVPKGVKAKLQFFIDEIKDRQDYNFTRVMFFGGLPTKSFDGALDRAIIKAGAEARKD